MIWIVIHSKENKAPMFAELGEQLDSIFVGAFSSLSPVLLRNRGLFYERKDVIALLSVKQEAFCLHYAKTGNATESYKQAGYNPKNDNAAGASARRLLLNVKIKDRLQELAEEMASDKIANIKEIQERLTRILRMEETEDQIVVEGNGDGCSDARIVKKRPALKDVIKAGETLGKMQGAFDNKMNVAVTVPVFGGEERLED